MEQTNNLGKVIRIISEKAIIIDVGSDYLTEGDKVQIYTAGEEIKDLDGNSLGVYEYIKATLDVVQTSKNYSICKNIVEKENTSLYSEFNNLSALYSRKQKVAEDLCVDTDDINPLHLDENKTIKLGDLVKKYWFFAFIKYNREEQKWLLSRRLVKTSSLLSRLEVFILCKIQTSLLKPIMSRYLF